MTRMMIDQKYKGTFLLLTLLALVLMVMPAAAQSAPPPVVRLEVNPLTAKVGDTVTIAVRLENVTGLFGIQVTCLVNPGVLAGLTRIEGDAFTSANGFYVDQGMKADGKWLIAATRLQPNPSFAGSGTAFTFQYQVLSAVNAQLNCTALGVDDHSQPLPITLVNGTPVVTVSGDGTVAIPTAVPTVVVPTVEATVVVPTATEIVPTEAPTVIVPTAEATADATVSASDPGTIQGLVVKQFASDNSGIGVQLTANGSLVQQSVTGADGSFVFSNVPAGTYVVIVSVPEHLSVMYNVTVTGNGTAVNLGTQTLAIGDTDANQTIDLADAVMVSANFALAVPPAPSVADLNGDGKIDISDLVLIGTNFGLTGPVVAQ